MVTRNFLNELAMMLQRGSLLGGVPARSVDGGCWYLSGTILTSTTQTATTDPNTAGISVGTGNSAPSEDDFNLESTITSGVTLTVTEVVCGNDSPGYPYIQYKITVTNTGSDPITVKEIGYKQSMQATKYPGYNDGSSPAIFLLDRTVLDTPVTIAAGDAGIITYKLRTIPRPFETVSGIQITSFADGTDGQIAAILDAAIAGDIDLQQDAGWRVGDKRKIHIDAFTGGHDVACPAQDMFIVISSFEEYNSGLGNVLQFDFVDALSAKFRMNSSNTTTGGYKESEMYTTTLPALANALPSWLRTRLKTFSVLASAGGSSLYTIETVTGNKLALRAAVEVFGADGNGQPGEGTQVDYFNASSNRRKGSGFGGSATTWWERSACTDSLFCRVSTDGSASSYSATSSNGVAPFGCI